MYVHPIYNFIVTVLGTVDFLKRIVSRVIAYDEANMHEMSRFTLDLALSMQADLKIGELMYDEMKLIHGFDCNNSASTIVTITSKSVHDYLCHTAFRTCDIEVSCLTLFI